MGLTCISSGMRSGLFSFLPTSCPHVKQFRGELAVLRCVPRPSVCLCSGLLGAVDLLTSEHLGRCSAGNKRQMGMNMPDRNWSSSRCPTRVSPAQAWEGAPKAMRPGHGTNSDRSTVGRHPPHRRRRELASSRFAKTGSVTRLLAGQSLASSAAARLRFMLCRGSGPQFTHGDGWLFRF
jgi:hypothetical protein